MKACENCNTPHDGSYGSGRFCSSKCARGFSTKAKRVEINEKVRCKLLRNDYSDRICKTCNLLYTPKSKKQKYCSHLCSPKRTTLGMTWTVKDSSKMGGPRPGGGRSIPIEYISEIAGIMKLNKDEIEVAECLDSIKVNWQRNNSSGFSYINLKGKSRKFYPDFYLPEENLYIEFKGWVTKEMTHKMNDALSKNDFNLLIVYGRDKRYRDLGLNLEDISLNPKLLFNK